MSRACLLLLLCAGCVRVDKATRVERGPLLRTFHRAEVLEGPLRARVTLAWPTLELEVSASDVCRDLTVEEYAEERITETSSPAAGPALSTGIANLAASAILLGVSALVSGQPDTSVIDARGHYGPSTRQQVQGWALGTLVVGAPALAVGVISLMRTGEEVVPLRAEQVVSQKDSACHQRPFAGPARLEGPHGPATPDKPLVEGRASFAATQLEALIEGVRAASREVELDGASQTAVDAFNACVELGAAKAVPLQSLPDDALEARGELLHRCRPVRGEATAEPLRAVEAELARRRGAASLSTAPQMTFEQALAAHAPALRLAVGSADLARLTGPEGLAGQAVLLEGVAGAAVADDLGLVTVGEVQVLLQLPGKRWKAELPLGTRMEAVAVGAGWSAPEGKRLVLLRGVAARGRF